MTSQCTSVPQVQEEMVVRSSEKERGREDCLSRHNGRNYLLGHALLERRSAFWVKMDLQNSATRVQLITTRNKIAIYWRYRHASARAGVDIMS